MSPAVEPAPRAEPLEFTGDGRDYFRLWLTNVVLTVATVGVYSAWAKARRLRYFARHTRLAGVGFDYHGDPAVLLRGRLVVALLAGAYSASGAAGPWGIAASLAAAGAVLPWLAARSFAFRCRHTSYRGLRFHFNGSIRGAYAVYLGLPALAVVALGTLAPFWHHRLKRYRHSHLAWGRSAFGFFGEPEFFYAAYVKAGLLTIGLTVALVLALAAVGALVTWSQAGAADPTRIDPASWAGLSVFGLALIGYAAVITAMQACLAARLGGHVWTHTTLGPLRFVWRIEAPRLFAIRFTNLVWTVATLGLYRPFGQVRLARYLTEAFVIAPAVGLDAFESAHVPDAEPGNGPAVAARTRDLEIAF